MGKSSLLLALVRELYIGELVDNYFITSLKAGLEILEIATNISNTQTQYLMVIMNSFLTL